MMKDEHQYKIRTDVNMLIGSLIPKSWDFALHRDGEITVYPSNLELAGNGKLVYKDITALVLSFR